MALVILDRIRVIYVQIWIDYSITKITPKFSCGISNIRQSTRNLRPNLDRLFNKTVMTVIISYSFSKNLSSTNMPYDQDEISKQKI